MSAPKWPQRVIDKLGRAPQVGDWCAPCCIEDLRQIETAEDLYDILDDMDYMDTGQMFWKTEKEALDALE